MFHLTAGHASLDFARSANAVVEAVDSHDDHSTLDVLNMIQSAHGFGDGHSGSALQEGEVELPCRTPVPQVVVVAMLVDEMDRIDPEHRIASRSHCHHGIRLAHRPDVLRVVHCYTGILIRNESALFDHYLGRVGPGERPRSFSHLS